MKDFSSLQLIPCSLLAPPGSILISEPWLCPAALGCLVLCATDPGVLLELPEQDVAAAAPAGLGPGPAVQLVLLQFVEGQLDVTELAQHGAQGARGCLMILQEAAFHLHPTLAGDLHVFRLNVVLHLRFWDGVAAVGAYFNISSTVDFMDDEVDCRNVLFAVAAEPGLGRGHGRDGHGSVRCRARFPHSPGHRAQPRGAAKARPCGDRWGADPGWAEGVGDPGRVRSGQVGADL